MRREGRDVGTLTRKSRRFPFHRGVVRQIPLAGLLGLIATLTLTCSGERDAELREKAIKSIQAGQAEAALRELQRIKKPLIDDYNLRGEVLFQLGRSRFPEAEAAFRRALQIDGRNSRALYGLAVLAVSRRDFPEAERLARDIFAIQPDAPHAKNLLAGALMYQGKNAEAEALFQGVEGDPDVGALAKGNLGELYLRQRKLELAERKLQEAVGLMPNHPEWHKHLGEVYRLQGQRGKAITEYRTAQNLLKKWTGDTALQDEVAATLRELEEKEK